MAIRASASAFGQLVAGELLADEAVVGEVAIEGADDVIAVAPGVGLGVVAFVAVAFRRTGPGRASAGPTSRRSGESRAGGRSGLRRRWARDRPGRLRLPWASGEVRSGQESAADQLLLGGGGLGVNPFASRPGRG